MSMTLRNFGNTGLRVSALGFGGSHIGGDDITNSDAANILHSAIDLGINLIDTARSYDLSEERIGLALGARRKEIILSTKIGYGIAGFTDWTAEIISAGITEALRLLRTDYLDIVHLHSCPLHTLKNSGVAEELQREVQSGRIRIAAYAGDNEEVEWAAASGLFGSVQCSINICDQRPISHTLPTAMEKQLGVIAKRPLGNAPWNRAAKPKGGTTLQNWERFHEMGMHDWGLDWADVALRFTAFTPGVHSCIVGTRNRDHLKANAEAVQRGPLDAELVARIRDTFQTHGTDWKSGI